jgi:hypothetical protein
MAYRFPVSSFHGGNYHCSAVTEVHQSPIGSSLFRVTVFEAPKATRLKVIHKTAKVLLPNGNLHPLRLLFSAGEPIQIAIGPKRDFPYGFGQRHKAGDILQCDFGDLCPLCGGRSA